MGFLQTLKRRQPLDSVQSNDHAHQANTDPKAGPEIESAVHTEHAPSNAPSKWVLSRSGDGDTAMALFASPADTQDPYTAAEEKKLVRKIDAMILPYLAVCYAFFYIDKTTLSYAAIFGIREDLDLHGDRYNWLSSIFYFGFLAWAFPTNFLMQKLPVGKYLGANIFLWGVFLMLQAAAKVRRLHIVLFCRWAHTALELYPACCPESDQRGGGGLFRSGLYADYKHVVCFPCSMFCVTDSSCQQVHSQTAARSYRTMVHCEWFWNRSRRPARLCYWAYQRRSAIPEI
jgi:hypothetical protein